MAPTTTSFVPFPGFVDRQLPTGISSALPYLNQAMMNCIQWFTISSGDTWNITTAAEKQRYVDFVKTKPTSIIALNHDVHQQTAWVPSPRRILIIITLNFILGEPAKSCSLSQSKDRKLQAINSLLWQSALVNRPIKRLLHLRLEMYACLVSNIHFYGILIGI